MGETTEEHGKWQQEEAALVEKDRANTGPLGGLFRGCFKRGGLGPRFPMGYLPRQPIRDLEDGVDRCPRCTWELEDGLCQSCGYPSGDEEPSDSDAPEYYPTMYDDGDVLDEAVLDALDHAGHPHGFHGFNGEYSPASLSEEGYMSEGGLEAVRNARYSHRSRRGPRSWSPYPDDGGTPYDSLDEGTDENSEDEEAGSLDGFVVDDDGERQHSPTGFAQSLQWETDEDTGADDMHSQDSEDEAEMDGGTNSDQDSMHIPASIRFASDEDSDEGPIPPSRRRILPRVTTLSDSSDGDNVRPMNTNRRPGSRNPLQARSDETFQSQHNIPHHSRATHAEGGRSRGVPIEIDSDSDAPVPASQRIRRRRGEHPRLAEEGSGAGDSSGTATVGRSSRRSTPPRKDDSRSEVYDRNEASPVVAESSRRRFAGNEHQASADEQASPPYANFGEPSRFSDLTAPNWNQATNNHPWPAQASASTNQGNSNSPRSTSDHNPLSSTSPNNTRRNHTNHRSSPLPTPRWYRESPTRAGPSTTEEQHFQQGVRDRQAQKAERKADRRRLKAERERRRSRDAARSASPARSPVEVN